MDPPPPFLYNVYHNILTYLYYTYSGDTRNIMCNIHCIAEKWVIIIIYGVPSYRNPTAHKSIDNSHATVDRERCINNVQTAH